MPRKLRIEYPGATYHVISRGNYRKDLFGDRGTCESFESAIFETADRCGWKLFAYVIMRNHYHLAVETPEANLVDGMRWLQSTFATRFNRFMNESGHVFQGRYKSIIVSEDRPLLGLIDYIHLNPVRARLCSIDQLRNHAFSSYPKYWERSLRSGLQRSRMLSFCGMPDTPAGMELYEQRLKLVDEGDPEKHDLMSKEYCKGWFVGTNEAKQKLASELEDANPFAVWDGADMRELNELRWERLVQEELTRAGKSEAFVIADSKGAAWKVEIAKRLRRETTARNQWIADRLCMGHPNYVSNLVNRDHIHPIGGADGE
ncbi:hypothetical protein PDESU_04482 [Pontiella desulfatans]|uniref:Transposase IS200-like domain-containing protein n=1 Tax=Pontiella desulfatans TaxID=2750659 RepID=A0A6C2U930_PONDE|nr:transposase [Pontiella desulfatans]VGO15894.1 hypothetical protein PDESU_04482 [Pontiella desulfatans]